MTIKNIGSEAKKEREADATPPLPSAPFSYDALDNWMSSSTAAYDPPPPTAPQDNFSQPHSTPMTASAPVASETSRPTPSYGNSNTPSPTLWQVLTNPSNYESLISGVAPTVGTDATSSQRASYANAPSSYGIGSAAASGSHGLNANYESSKIPMAIATPIVDPTGVGALPVVAATDPAFDAQLSSTGMPAAPQRDRPPFYRPERASLLPKRHCCYLLPLWDQYPVPREDKAPAHWTHPKAASEILTDLDWTDAEAHAVAALLYKRSAACFWASYAGALVILTIIFFVATGGCEDEGCNNPMYGSAIILLLGGILVAFPCLQLVTNHDKAVTRIVDRTFREDGTRFEIVV